MAYIRRRKGSWQTVIRVQGYPPITKTFKTKIDAQRYSRDLENKLFRQKYDIAKKKFPIMRDALIRYRDEVTVHKRSKEMETKLIGYILSEGFVNYALNLVDRSLIAQYRDRALRSLKSSSVNRRLAIISHLFTIRSAKIGVSEIDLLALGEQLVQTSEDNLTTKIIRRHIEVQISFKPVGFITGKSAKKRSKEQIEIDVDMWLHKKFF